MDLNYKREATVGSLVIAAIVLFFIGTTWLSGRSITSSFDDYYRIQFKEAANLKTSSAVRVSGVPVGKVEAIRLVRPGLVLVYVSLRDDLVPKTDASATVVSVGFVGDAVVEINPGTGAQTLPKSQPIMGTQQVGFTDRAAALGDRADSLLIGAQAIVNQRTADQLYATMQTLQGTLRAAERTMAVYGNPNRGPTAEITRTMTSLQALSARLDSTLGNPALARTLSRTDTLTGNLAIMTSQLTVTSARLDTVLANVSAGRGTIGKFATDGGFYGDVRELSQSMKRLIDELQKHPGKVPVTVKLF